MIETMTSKLKSWASAHLSPLKIDFMSLNRLRLNQSVESIFETNIPYTEQARKGYMDLRAYLPDLSLTLDNPKVLLNPFGRAPLFALIVFHSETPCHVSYTVHGHQEENSFSRTLTEETTVHVVPVFGLYAGEANQITVSLLDETETETGMGEGNPAGECHVSDSMRPWRSGKYRRRAVDRENKESPEKRRTSGVL